MKLDKKEVEHIADLARIELTDQEKSKFSQQLTQILDWIDQLAEVDTKEIGVGLRNDLSNITAEDEIATFTEADSLTASFPEVQDNQLKVKGIK